MREEIERENKRIAEGGDRVDVEVVFESQNEPMSKSELEYE